MRPHLTRIRRSKRLPGLLAALPLLAACDTPSGDDDNEGAGNTFDVSARFPVEEGRYWVYFDPDSRFLTLEFTGVKEVVGVETQVLTWTFDRDTTSGEAVAPAYEQYFAVDPELGVLLYGYRDYEQGESATFLPGVLFAGLEMDEGEPVETVTSASGALASYTATVVDHGIVQTYYGEFPDAVALTFGPSADAPSKYFLALEKGLVKFDLDGVRFQLYDYGVRETVADDPE